MEFDIASTGAASYHKNDYGSQRRMQAEGDNMVVSEIEAAVSAMSARADVEPLERQLRGVIDHLADSIRMSKLIALNVSLLSAGLSHNMEENSAAIQVVATEIQRLSDESDRHVDHLRHILADVKLLTRTINLAGRQRMFSQKIMKHFLIQRLHPSPENERAGRQLKTEFEDSLVALQSCELNTGEIKGYLRQVKDRWDKFAAALESSDIESAIQLNEEVLTAMQSAVQHYEALAGNHQ